MFITYSIPLFFILLCIIITIQSYDIAKPNTTRIVFLNNYHDVIATTTLNQFDNKKRLFINNNYVLIHMVDDCLLKVNNQIFYPDNKHPHRLYANLFFLID